MTLVNCHSEDGTGPINGIVRTNGYVVGNLWDGGVEHESDGSSLRCYSVVCNV